MMKFGILTWFKETNHGAVLQAYASQHVIKGIGIEPVFLDYEWGKEQIVDNKNVLIRRMKKLFSGDFLYRNIYHNMKRKKVVIFEEFIHENFQHIGSCYDEQYDTVMVGSDMVFNLSEGWHPYMFGIDVKTNRIFSYAACSGGEKSIEIADKLELKDKIREGLTKFTVIGCRDKDTIQFVEEIADIKQTTDNIDPVLLYGFELEKIHGVKESGSNINHIF